MLPLHCRAAAHSIGTDSLHNTLRRLNRELSQFSQAELDRRHQQLPASTDDPVLILGSDADADADAADTSPDRPGLSPAVSDIAGSHDQGDSDDTEEEESPDDAR